MAPVISLANFYMPSIPLTNLNTHSNLKPLSTESPLDYLSEVRTNISSTHEMMTMNPSNVLNESLRQSSKPQPISFIIISMVKIPENTKLATSYVLETHLGWLQLSEPRAMEFRIIVIQMNHSKALLSHTFLSFVVQLKGKHQHFSPYFSLIGSTQDLPRAFLFYLIICKASSPNFFLRYSSLAACSILILSQKKNYIAVTRLITKKAPMMTQKTKKKSQIQEF